MSRETLEKLSLKSARLGSFHAQFKEHILSMPPYSLGFPSGIAQSSYYTGEVISKDEIALVSSVFEENSIFPENTRIHKSGDQKYEILQASVESSAKTTTLTTSKESVDIQMTQGDHSSELSHICEHLTKAAENASNDTQRKFLQQYIESFQTGDLDVYRESQKTWISDKAPRVENIFGFVEPYRDPYGIRAEFEGLVAIADPHETRLLSRLVSQSDKFIRRLPWASPENNGKGPFEKALFEPPDFSSIHGRPGTCSFKDLHTDD